MAAHTARLAARLVTARPDLEPRLTRRLLALDRTHVDPGRRDRMKSYLLEAMGTCRVSGRSRRTILQFAEGMLASSSPRAFRAAGACLKQRGNR